MKLIEFCACFTAKNEVKNIWANRVDIACFLQHSADEKLNAAQDKTIFC
jgi:hypothetical protein